MIMKNMQAEKKEANIPNRLKNESQPFMNK
jgi:hypothetical protein